MNTHEIFSAFAAAVISTAMTWAIVEFSWQNDCKRIGAHVAAGDVVYECRVKL